MYDDLSKHVVLLSVMQHAVNKKKITHTFTHFLGRSTNWKIIKKITGITKGEHSSQGRIYVSEKVNIPQAVISDQHSQVYKEELNLTVHNFAMELF